MSKTDLFVISAPSGTGKTTLIKRLLGGLPGIDFSVSFTTRPSREGERDGVDYHFVDQELFERMVRAGEFLEWAQVHGQRYGTSARLVEESQAAGKDVLLDVDTQGATAVRNLRDDAVLVFILPPDFETLRSRLRQREHESAEEIERRMSNARHEMEKHDKYDYLIINDSLQEALRRLEAIVLAHRSRASRQQEACRRILASFRKG